jgi:outer membrane protein OmpA-like peptidoglycan-associated protein
METKQGRVGCALVALLFLTGLAHAQDEKKKETAPSLDGTSGLFRTWDADTLRRSEFNFSLGATRYNRDPGQLRFSLVPVAAAFGITDRFEVFASLEAARLVRARNIRTYRVLPGRLPVAAWTPGGAAAFNNEAPFIDVPKATGLGNANLGLKFNLFSERRHDPLSVGLVGFVKLPTAGSFTELNRGLGNDAIEGGWGFLASKNTRFAQFHANAMVNWVQDPEESNIQLADLQHEFWYRGGVGIPVARVVQAIAEVDGKSYFGSRTFGLNPRSPIDVILGLRLFAGDWIVLGAGYRASVNRIKDDPVLNHRATNPHGFVAQLGIRRRINVPPTVTCAIANPNIKQGETTTIRVNAVDPDGDTLTYTWSSTGGKVTGTGDTATFDATGVAPGRYTVTATVSDGKHQVSCSSEVNVIKRNEAPTVSCAPETTTITAGETTTIRASASDPNNDALTYTWTVNGQRVAADGPTFSFGSAGREPGTYRIEVTVSDGELTAKCSSTVTVNPAVRPNRAPTIECLTTSVDVASGGTVQLQVRTSDPDGDPVTVTWSATGGTVTGSGNTATFNAAGLRAGSYTVTAAADDGKGGRASCNLTVNVSERISLTREGRRCGDFAPGRARVDNCAKGVLDDVAVRMQNDPRLRANLIGYTDTTRADRGLGKRRAQAVSDYLTKQKRIDASRLTVTDGGTSNPIGDNKTVKGRKQNRRVEIELTAR